MAATDAELIHQTLKKNMELFAWSAADVPGVNPEVITHQLSVYKDARRSRKRKETLVKKRGLRPGSRLKNSSKLGSFVKPDTQLG